MDRLMAEAGTSYFWLVQVVLAVLVSVAAAYLKGPLDALWGRFSERRRKRTDAVRLQSEAAAVALTECPEDVQFLIATETRHYLIGLVLMVFAATAMSFGLSSSVSAGVFAVWLRPLMSLLGLVLLIMGVSLISKGLDHAATLRRAQQLFREARGPKLIAVQSDQDARLLASAAPATAPNALPTAGDPKG